MLKQKTAPLRRRFAFSSENVYTVGTYGTARKALWLGRPP